jgi:hypothetical protein
MRSLLTLMTIMQQILLVIAMDHCFPRQTEFRAEPRNLCFAAENLYCRGIPRNWLFFGKKNVLHDSDLCS